MIEKVGLIPADNHEQLQFAWVSRFLLCSFFLLFSSVFNLHFAWWEAKHLSKLVSRRKTSHVKFLACYPPSFASFCGLCPPSFPSFFQSTTFLQEHHWTPLLTSSSASFFTLPANVQGKRQEVFRACQELQGDLQ